MAVYIPAKGDYAVALRTVDVFQSRCTASIKEHGDVNNQSPRGGKMTGA